MIQLLRAAAYRIPTESPLETWDLYSAAVKPLHSPFSFPLGAETPLFHGHYSPGSHCKNWIQVSNTSVGLPYTYAKNCSKRPRNMLESMHPAVLPFQGQGHQSPVRPGITDLETPLGCLKNTWSTCLPWLQVLHLSPTPSGLSSDHHLGKLSHPAAHPIGELHTCNNPLKGTKKIISPVPTTEVASSRFRFSSHQQLSNEKGENGNKKGRQKKSLV